MSSTMNIRFKKQQYQLNAVKAVVDCFKGQSKNDGITYRIDPGKANKKVVNGQGSLDLEDDLRLF